ncbi:Hpt domain-containing protein [Aurantiacibacter sp. D1-12]|uniref:Hpt domain-containing protein n=1 Tax=Aurantiacibacter sp. D1-12 TaxID=2993658 RepID=UPI00237D27C9|nr:Hpt domain-containing protein [Aurantiacibacter sp. D1-12]MDE1466635.1 Hpt domain-containing protein [Aurantiacibacter sp. D1-12]
MAYAHGDFEMALTAAAGEDLALLAELRTSFVESMRAQLDLLSRSRCDANWNMAAQRMRGLGMSFHASELVKLADEALDGAPGDPAVLRKLDALIEGFSSE